MNIEIKEIIDELITYRKTREPIKHLKNIYDKLGDREIIQLIGWLLLWHKEVFLDLAKPEKLEISETLYNRYLEFFKECPSIKKVFKLNKEYVNWNENITEEEQEEIRNYIHENYKIQIRIRRYKQ